MKRGEMRQTLWEKPKYKKAFSSISNLALFPVYLWSSLAIMSGLAWPTFLFCEEAESNPADQSHEWSTTDHHPTPPISQPRRGQTRKKNFSPCLYLPPSGTRSGRSRLGFRAHMHIPHTFMRRTFAKCEEGKETQYIPDRIGGGKIHQLF